MLLLAACGSDKASSSSSSWGKSCDDASAATVNSALGTSFGDPKMTSKDDVVVCLYTDTSSSLTGTVRFQKSTTHQAFTVERQSMDAAGQKTTDLDGAGDEAYSSTFQASNLIPELNTVVALKGSHEVLITASAPIDKEKDLANKLLG